MTQFEVDGVLKRLVEVADENKVVRGIQKASALVERAAKNKAPKDTGELRRSITSVVESDGSEVKGIIYTPLLYAPYVEYGTGLFAVGEGGGRKDVPWHYQDDKGEWHTTSGMKPQPYMIPALTENREEIIKLIREAVGND